MELLNLAGIIFGSSLTSGINLYLTAAGLGIAHRFNWIELPGNLEVLSNPWVIAAAIVLYLIEFVADKVPYVDSVWDSLHTFVRPVGGAAIAYLATTENGPIVQAASSLAGGMLALDSHAVKAGTRAAINTSPEPVTNSVASVTEDTFVLGSLWLIITNPWIMLVIIIVFIGLSIWLLPKIARFFGKVFGYFFRPKKQSSA